ncbi:MAG: FimV/HubP family polar landmark protein [Pseudomonadota bacterium]
MALAPIAVFSAGLGKLNVSSGLGEPLRADIELLSVTPEELNSIFAVIASEEAYAIQGIDRPASHNTIKVEVGKNANGTPILKLKSTQPISEPFLDMLIQVDWASGRLLREYTVLLDPPGYVGETESTTTQLPAVKSTVTPSQNSTVNSTVVKKSTTSDKPRQARPAQAANDSATSSAEEYQTQRGDSLAKIAREYKPEDISLDQMLVGLYQANPSAFDGKNMNRLKVGKIIRLPSEQELASLSRQQASKEVKVQSANWNEYRNKLAGIVAESAPSESEASTQSADGKIKSAAEDKSMPATTGPKDVVKLSAGEAALTKKEADDVKNLQAKITALQEESTAREKSVIEAQEKTAALEKQIADMQQLLALKNGAMSDMQKQAEMQAALDKKANDQMPPAIEQPVETAPVAEPAPANVEPPAPPVAVVNPSVQPAPVVVAEPVAEAGFLDGVDLPLLGTAAGILALLGGGWMYLRNKRKRNLADFEQGIMTSGGLKANTVFGNTSGSSVDTGDTSFLTDFSQSANGGMIDTNDVDPIAEAEVYMAYGRDAQAEEILKDAISKEPKRYELHLKLLEMYAASKNVSAFETIAGELYTTLGAEDPTWAKVAEIGHNLEPSNPLYQANTAHSAAHGTNEKLQANDFSDSPIASETDLDFTFDNDSLLQNSASSTSDKDAFDLELDALANQNPDEMEFTSSVAATESLTADTIQSLAKADPAPEELAPEINAAAAESNDALDFDFGNLTPAAETPVEAEDANFGHTMPGLDMSGFTSTKIEPELAADTSDTPQLSESNLTEPGLTDVEEISFATVDSPVEESNFNFDLSSLSPEAASYVDDDAATANTYDLSAISLDMTDADTIQNANSSEDLESSEDQPIEIETKLDLVAAYIEMDDSEGAKELLDEVMKEGSAAQRKRAEALLVKLG